MVKLQQFQVQKDQLQVLGTLVQVLLLKKTTTQIQDITLTVFDPSKLLGSFDGWTGTANDLDCIFTATSVSITPDATNSALQTFSLDTANKKFQVWSINMGNIGTFTATLQSGSLWSTQFTVTVLDPCLVTTLTASSALTPLSCKVQQCTICTKQAPSTNTAIDVNQSKTLQICSGVSYSISAIADTGVITSLSSSEIFVSSSGMISVAATTGDQVGSHQVTLVTYLTNYPDIKTSDQKFTLNIQPQDYINISPQLVAKTWELSTISSFQYQLSIDTTTSCNFQPTSWTVQATSIGNSASTSNFQTISATGLFTAGPFNQLTVLGDYTITVTSLTINGAPTSRIANTASFPNSFSLTVTDPCPSAIVSSSVISDLECYVFDPVSISSAFTSFTYVVAGSSTSTLCGSITYSVSVALGTATNMITTFSVNSLAQTFSFQSLNMNQLGTFTVTLQGYLTNYTSRKASKTFKVTVQHPCWKTTLIWISPWTSMTYNVSQATAGNYQAAFNDAVDSSQNLGILQLCGALTYQSINDSPNAGVTALSLSELTLSPSGGISIATTNKLTIGLHTISLNVFLSQFTNITKTQTIQLQIYPCYITGFTAILPTSQSYTINDPILSWKLTAANLASQTPNCGYIQTSTTDLSTLPSFSTISSTVSDVSLTSYSRLKSFAGFYSILIDVSLSGYPYSPVPKTTASQSLTVIDPCLSATIQGPTNITGPTQVQNFIAFAGYNQTSSSNYTFNDSISLSATLPTDPVDFCGNKTIYFKINSTKTDVLNGLNTQKVTFSPLANSTEFGTQPTVMFVCLQDYPQICQTFDINATTLGSKVPFIPPQNYQTSQQKVNILIDPPFQVFPNDYNFGTPLVVTYSAYILTQGTSLSSPIDLSSRNLTEIKDQGWITFNSTTQTVQVFTTSNSYQGIWTIVVVQSFNQFPRVNPFSQFYLIMTPRIFQPQPPYFQPPLQNWVINICPGEQTKLWKFMIPTPIDPSDVSVTMKVVVNPVIFTFEESIKTIFQMKEQSTPSNQTISIQLTDEVNATATYTMKVEFLCKVVNTTTVAEFTPTLKLRKQTTWPEAYIKQVDFDGLMHIVFRQRMKIPENITEILNSQIKINETDYPNMIITVIPGQLSDKQQLNFTSEIVNFTTTELLIQLNFQNPQYVSSNNKYREQIKVQIYGVHLFADTYANLMLPGVQLKQVYLPSLASAVAVKQAQSVASQAQGAITSVMASNFVAAIFVSQPLQQLLGSIRHLQIIIHAMLLNLAYPAVANVCFGMLMNLLTFQFFSFVNFFNRVLSLDPNGEGNNPYNNQFNAMGYGAMYIIQNFGMLCFTLFITPVLYLTAVLIHKKFPEQMESLKLSLSRQMFYGNWIKLINETFLFLGVCAMINCQYLKFDTYGNAINSLSALLCSIILVAFPFFIIVFFNIPKNYQKVLNRDEDFMARYGQVLDNLNFLRMGQKDTLYPFFSFLRKISLIYVVVFMQEKPVFSIFTLIYQAIFMVTLIGYIPPFTSRLQNQLELVNESFVLLVNYQLFNFTDFLPDALTREYVGYSLVITTFACIFINIGVVGQSMASILLQKLKKYFYQWRHFRAVKKIREQRKLQTLMRAIEHKKNREQKIQSKGNSNHKTKGRKNLNQQDFANQQFQSTQFDHNDAFTMQQLRARQNGQNFNNNQKHTTQIAQKLQNQNHKELDKRVKYDQFKRFLEQDESYQVKMALEQQRRNQYVSEYIKSSLGWKNAERKRLEKYYRTMNEEKRQKLRDQLEKEKQKQKSSNKNNNQNREQNQAQLQADFKQYQQSQLNNQLVLQDYSEDEGRFQIDQFQPENRANKFYTRNNDIELGARTQNNPQGDERFINAKTKLNKSLMENMRQKYLKPRSIGDSVFPQEEFRELNGEQLQKLRKLFTEINKNAPRSWAEVDKKICDITFSDGPNFPLWDKALTKFKSYSKDWQFAKEHEEDIEDAIQYRNGTMEKAIQKYHSQRCRMLQKMQLIGLTEREMAYFWGNLIFGDVTDNMSVKDKFNLYKMIVEHGSLYKQLQEQGARPQDPPDL